MSVHGVLLRGFKHFVVDRYGRDTWESIVATSAVEPKVYLPVRTYPDDEAATLMSAAAAETAESRGSILRTFGRDVAAQLFETYGSIVPAEWDALDVVENAEATIHATLRERNTDLSPPRLTTRRDDPEQVNVVYSSERALCDVAWGIIQGVGDHYRTALSIEESQCVHDGAAHCELLVTSSDDAA